MTNDVGVRALHVSGVLAVVLIAGVGTALSTGGPLRGSASVAAMLLALGPAVLWQALVRMLARTLRPRSATLLRRLQIERFVTRDPAAPREPVIWVHGLGLALGLWLLLLGVGSRLLLQRLRSVEDIALREALSMAGVLGLALGTLALAACALGPLRHGLRRLDRHARLPLPPAPALRTILWLGLPICLLAIGGIYALAGVLGPLATPLWLVLLVGVHIVLHALGAPVSRQLSHPGWLLRTLNAAAVPLALLGMWAADRIIDASPELSVELEQAQPSGLLLSAARTLSDVDRDGASSRFGERDCAAFSAARSPFARDIPGNGIDENCDGADDRLESMPRAPTFFGGLPKDQLQQYDIAWFIIDALRADHASFLGYHRPTTPNLEALAKESIVFSRAYSQSSATMLSIPSMLSGVDPGRVRWIKESGRLQVDKQQEQRYLSKLLATRGYQTGLVTIPYFRKRLPGLLGGFEWVGIGSADNRKSSSSAAAQAAQFISRARRKRAPMFAMTYFPAPHAPYVRHVLGYPSFGDDEQSNYDLEIVNADRHLGFVLDVLRADPKRWSKTIVIVTADHGEEFGEHGQKTHARSCHVESLHVPLLVRIPGHQATRIERPVALIDIVPTLLELTAAVDVEPGWLDGSSLLLQTKAPERVPADRPLFCSVVSQKRAQGDFARRSVQSGKWKLMTELRGSVPARLFDLEVDPRERSPVPLSGEAAKIAARLDGWLGAQLTGNVHLVDMSDE